MSAAKELPDSATADTAVLHIVVRRIPVRHTVELHTVVHHSLELDNSGKVADIAGIAGTVVVAAAVADKLGQV